MRHGIFAASVVLALAPTPLWAREWSDATGMLTFEADLISHDGGTAVLKRDDDSLVAVQMGELSEEDQKFLAKADAVPPPAPTAEDLQTWTLADGFQLTGKVVDFVRKEVTIQRRRGKIYVNDRPLENLPEFYRDILPKVVEHFEGEPIRGRNGFRDWVLKQKGVARTFTVDGVMLELENGDEYGVPFFLFGEGDLAVLARGWDRWTAAHATEEPLDDERERVMLASEAEAYHDDRQTDRQISLMQLQLLAAAAGVVDIWEVALFPGNNTAAPPLSVIVPARNSLAAQELALQQNPGYVVGPTRKLK